MIKLWIALAHVRPKTERSSLSRGAKGAFANALAMAENCHEFEEKIRQGIRDDGLELIELQEAEPFDEKSARQYLSAEMLALADEAQTSGTVCFDTFYNYFTDEEIT